MRERNMDFMTSHKERAQRERDRPPLRTTIVNAVRWALFIRDFLRASPTQTQHSRCIVDACRASSHVNGGMCASHEAVAEVCLSLAIIHEQVNSGSSDLQEAVEAAHTVVAQLEFLAGHGSSAPAPAASPESYSNGRLK